MRPDVLLPATQVRALTAALDGAEAALRRAVAVAARRGPGVRPLGSRSAHRTLAGVFLDLLCCHCLLRAPWSATAASRLVPELLRQSAEELGLYFGPHVPDGPGGHGAAGREQLSLLRAELTRLPSGEEHCPLDRDRIEATLVRLRSATGGTPHTAWLRSAAPLLLSELASLEQEFGGRDPFPYRRPATALAERRALLVAAGACTETWLAARADAPSQRADAPSRRGEISAAKAVVSAAKADVSAKADLSAARTDTPWARTDSHSALTDASSARTDTPSAFVADPAWLTGVLQRTVVRLGTAPLPGPAPDISATATAEVLERCAQGRRFDLCGTPL
ncbi:hypothetical protein [Streptomyces griseorubiginosus]|uniref:hypothetical protein n=1 Tax=Streptomyces griseorubiginosus TaxID=67304 RepID=UPI0036664CA6